MAKIQYILDTKTGEQFRFSDILNDNILSLKEFRIEWAKHLKFKKPLYVCGLCEQPLSLRSGVKDKKQLFLVHPKKSPDCTWKSGREISYEEALKMFHNIKESEEHKMLKAFIVTQLNKDKYFHNAVPEKRVTNYLTEVYKIPDVRASQITYWNKIKIEKHIVFEIQLSTTFLDVILEREKFYFENNDNLIWIFAHYPKDLSKTKMTEDDILFTSKKNIFVLDDEAKDLSIKNNSLYLKNIHLIPIIDSKGEIDSKWSDSKLLNINEITFDQISGKSYFYNFEHHRTKLLFGQKMKDISYYHLESVMKYIDKSRKEESHFGRLLNENVSNPSIDEHIIEAIHKSKKIIGYILEIIYVDYINKKTGEDIKLIFSDTFDSVKNRNNRIKQILGVIFNPIQKNNQYADIIIRAIDYYGKSNYILSLYENKEGKINKFINNIQYSRKYMMDDLPEHYTISLKYLFPELFYISSNPNRRTRKIKH